MCRGGDDERVALSGGAFRWVWRGGSSVSPRTFAARRKITPTGATSPWGRAPSAFAFGGAAASPPAALQQRRQLRNGARAVVGRRRVKKAILRPSSPKEEILRPSRHVFTPPSSGRHCATGGAAGGDAAAPPNAMADGARPHGEVAPVEVIFHLAAKVRGLSLEPTSPHPPERSPGQRNALIMSCRTAAHRSHLGLPCTPPSLTTLLSHCAALRVLLSTSIIWESFFLIGAHSAQMAGPPSGGQCSSCVRAISTRKKAAASARRCACDGPACMHVRCAVRRVRGATLVPVCFRDKPPWMYV